MADDLDDFFDEIEEVEAEAVNEDETPDKAQETSTSDDKGETTQDEPPNKRMKKDTPEAAPVRPRGVVVAAASSAVVRKPATDETTNDFNNYHASSASTNGVGASHLPPAPAAVPVPPPMPPLPPDGTPPPPSATDKKPPKRMAAGKVWVDPTLDEWPENDFRIFCGNLDKSVTEQQLYDHYKKYASLAKAKLVQDSNGISKGYGFVSFLQPLDCAKAIRETDQTWLGSRPIRVKRSDWKDRNMNQVLKKNKKQSKQRKRMGL